MPLPLLVAAALGAGVFFEFFQFMRHQHSLQVISLQQLPDVVDFVLYLCKC